MRAIYTTKAIAIGGILAAFWLTKLFIFPDLPAEQDTIVILAAMMPTLAVVAWRSEHEPVSLLTVSIAADIVAITVGIYFGGGVDNTSGPLLYSLIVVLAGLVLSEPANYFTAGACAVSYATMVAGEHYSVLPHLVPYGKPPNDALATVVIVSVYLVLIAWVGSYAIRQMRIIYLRAEQMRGEAVSALSHDLKNPLSIIQGYAELAEGVSPAERAEYLRRILSAAQQALDMVRNVLDSDAVEGRPITPTLQLVRLNDLVRQVIESYQFAAEERHIQVFSELAAASPMVQADARLLSRAIGNLLANAIKFSEPEGVVRLTTSADDTIARIAVTDRGLGISQSDRAHLFKKYHRTDTARKVEGSGLGLYIVARIVEAHGGHVAVASRVGLGSTFTIELPLTAS